MSEGIQGYSAPCPDHVVFSVSTHRLNPVLSVLLSEHGEAGIGSYKGKQESAYVLPKVVFDFFMFTNPSILHGQESVLILGTPEARNWRPATLRYLDGRLPKDLGMWIECTEKYALSMPDWSLFNNRWYVCVHDPIESEGDREERITAVKELAYADALLCIKRRAYLHDHVGKLTDIMLGAESRVAELMRLP